LTRRQAKLKTLVLNKPYAEEVMVNVDVYHALNHAYLLADGKSHQVVTIPDLAVMRFPWTYPLHGRILAPRLHQLVRRWADAVITISRSAKADITELLRLPDEQVFVTYPGIGPEFTLPDREKQQCVHDRYGLPNSYVLFIGNLNPRKNLLRLIDAYSLLRHSHPDLPCLVLVGTSGYQVGKVLGRIQKLRLEEHIIMPGYIDQKDLPAVICSALLLVYPSLYEGFGLPALEAMACGTPVVASNTSSLPEVVDEAGVLVDPFDVEAIAEGILSVLMDSQKAAHLRHRGLQRASLFTWERTARETLEVYEQVAGHGGTLL
jgi:glycosyltransferase involved in cell wall biosynthesis